MIRRPELYSVLASLLDYPAGDYLSAAGRGREFIDQIHPEASRPFSAFHTYFSKTALEQLEEVYARTFDVNAVCHLDVGYQLFGEDYKRGALLVELSRVQKEANNDTGFELADHLPSLLRMLPKMAIAEEREELARKLILPAMKKMIASFKEGSENAYLFLLHAIYSVLESDFGLAEEFPVQPDIASEIPPEVEREGTYV